MTDQYCKVFVYGTLKRGYGNNRALVFGGARYHADDQITGFALFDLGPFPAIQGCTDLSAHVDGEIWEHVNDSLLAQLDALENVDRGMYRRDAVMTVGDVPVYVYVWNHVNLAERFTRISRWPASLIPQENW